MASIMASIMACTTTTETETTRWTTDDGKQKETTKAYASLNDQTARMAVQVESAKKELIHAQNTLGSATDDTERAAGTTSAATARAGEFLLAMDEQLTEFQLSRAQRKKAIDEQQDFVLAQQKTVNAAEANVTEASVAMDQAVAARERASADLLRAKVRMSKKLSELGYKADMLRETCKQADNLEKCQQEESALKTQIENAKAEEKDTLGDLKPKATEAAEKAVQAVDAAKSARKYLEDQQQILLQAEHDAMEAALLHEHAEDEFSNKLQGLQAELANAQKQSDQARNSAIASREQLRDKELELKGFQLQLAQLRKEQQSATAEQDKTATNLKIAEATVATNKADTEIAVAKLVKIADSDTALVQEMVRHSEEVQALDKRLEAGVEDIAKARLDIEMLVGRLQSAASKVGQISEQLELVSVDFDKMKIFALQRMAPLEAGLEQLQSSREAKELELARVQTTITQAGQRLLEASLFYGEVSLNIQERNQITKGVEDGLANLMKV